MQGNSRPIRIGLVHALEESVAPARAAFARGWPEAKTFDLLDTSLSSDLTFNGKLDDLMMKRFEALGDYASKSIGEGGKAAALLFTCSAFGSAIEVVKARLDIPVYRPNEAAFAEALSFGRRIGLIVSYEASLKSLTVELEQMASRLGHVLSMQSAIADGALTALKRGDGDTHDAIVAETAAALGDIDVLILGQFSLARASSAVAARVSVPVITTPASAVRALRRHVLGAGSVVKS